MRKTLFIAAMTVLLTGRFAHSASTNDEAFANAALRELHNLARASAQIQQAAKDGDEIGCKNANESIQNAAHNAFENMHSMSFQPFDAIDNVSSLLKVSRSSSPNACPYQIVTDTGMLLMKAGQTVMSLRYDYAIGDSDWYMIDATYQVQAKNPLRYAQSLRDQNYSWVDVRPKDMILMIEPDWKAEMSSHQVDDPSIENSGNNLKAVEVGFRKNSDQSNNTTIYFYRTRDEALAAAQARKLQADNNAKAAAQLRESDAEWRQKLTSLPYMVANNDVGFKLVYAVCKPTGKLDPKGGSICSEDDSHDWSDGRGVPYKWFNDVKECEDAKDSINTKHPADVKVNGDDFFTSSCVPASKVKGRTLKGYKMVFALSAPGADDDDDTYADLRESGSPTARIFKTFNTCSSAVDTEYPKTMKDLGADENGYLLNDKTKSINVTATCVRVY